MKRRRNLFKKTAKTIDYERPDNNNKKQQTILKRRKTSVVIVVYYLATCHLME
jgi:hypothetical protein